MEIKNKVILIHGGTSGIGKELVSTFVSKRANVVFSGTNKQKGQDVIDGLSKHHKGKLDRNVMFYNMDVTDWQAQEDIYYATEKAFRKTVDIVIIVAGILDSSNLINDTEKGTIGIFDCVQKKKETKPNPCLLLLIDGHYMTIDVNLTATVKANRLAIQYFLKNNKSGCIINTSSVYGLTGGPTAPMYAATKHAIIGLTKSYGNLLRSTDIRVNAIAPHFVETPMIPGESYKVVRAFGMVPIEDCIKAYLQVIQDDSLDGDILSVSHLGTMIEPRFATSLLEQLDDFSHKRREDVLNALLDEFK
ncbi:hypothetical protein BD560DRAFT_391229 [Blakeslea trispora]|nr:hypothetical protein BD560DRAFT_391229 [Blakeslea trispora]